MSHDLDLDAASLGACIAVFFSVLAIAAVPSGVVVQRRGARWGMVTATSLSAAGLVGMASSPTWPVLACFLAVAAVAASIVQPAANDYLAGAVSLHRQGLAFGFKQAAGPASTLLVAVIVPWLSGSGTWRLGMLLGAGANIGLCVASVRLAGPHEGLRSTEAPIAPLLAAPIHVLTVLGAAAGLASAATVSLGGFIVTYGTDRGLTSSAAASLLSVGSVIAIVLRVVGGVLADRRGRRHLFTVALLMLGGSVGFVLIGTSTSMPLLMLGTAFAFGLGWSWNGVFAFAVVFNSPDRAAAATGIVQTGIALGCAVGGVFFGLAATFVSFRVAWFTAAIAMVTAACLVIMGRHLLARHRVDPQ